MDGGDPQLRVDTLLARPVSGSGEERRDQRGVDVADVEPGGRCGCGCGRRPTQPQRVAIEVSAGVALNRQPLGEERLDGGCQRGHDRCPCAGVRRAYDWSPHNSADAFGPAQNFTGL